MPRISLAVTLFGFIIAGSGLAGAETERADESVPPLLGPEEPSVSCGWANRGALGGARELASVGLGYIVPEPWRSRQHSFGTGDLVGLLQRAAARVALEHPGAVLGIADLSKKDGGAVPGHRSHQSGRDADLIYYSLDPLGQPRVPDSFMAYYSATGLGHFSRSPTRSQDIPQRYLDLARNWSLVKALMTDPVVEVEQLFVSHRIKRWLLAYAATVGESPEVIALATRTLRRPSRGESHNDHMHIRVACSELDITAGRCRKKPYRRARGGKWYSRMPCPHNEVARR